MKSEVGAYIARISESDSLHVPVEINTGFVSAATYEYIILKFTKYMNIHDSYVDDVTNL